MPRTLSLAFPKVRYFPRAMTLAPLIEANFLNYGHWISKGLGHLAALWSHHVGGDPHVVFLIYELPFVVDVCRLLLGDAYDTRVYLYQPDMLDFAEHVIFVGPKYFHITDNLSPEAGASIRSMLGGFLPTRTSFQSSLHKPPVFLVTDRTEQNARGRRWLNFDRSLDVIRSCFEPAFTVKSYVCGHHSFTEQMAAFAEAEAVMGVDGSCLENILWMPPESVAITVIPSKTNYIPIMPVKECGYTYAWKMADTINASTFALLVPEFGMFDDVHVPELSLLRVLRAVRSRILARPKQDDRPRVSALPEC